MGIYFDQVPKHTKSTPQNKPINLKFLYLLTIFMNLINEYFSSFTTAVIFYSNDYFDYLCFFIVKKKLRQYYEVGMDGF